MNQDYKQTLWILQQLPVLVSGLAPRAAKEKATCHRAFGVQQLENSYIVCSELLA
jgi:hypothetical protein